MKNPKTLSNIKRGFLWGYEDMLESMVLCYDDRTTSDFLHRSLEKKK
ncbi:MAG TPA: hypothetical protein VJ854_05175 [Sphaerochaeta sp.]|nr:hypothetical protein [Sphaerochaeta sp.]